MIACSGASPRIGPASIASASAASSATAPPICDTTALEAKGDLDGVLEALGRCANLPLDQRMHGAELLVSLGEVAAAKEAASEIAASARERGGPGPELGARIDAVLATPDPAPRPLADVLAEVDALVARARSEREPARWIDRAKAKHALSRATGQRATPVLVGRTGIARWAAGHALFDVQVHGVPLGAQAESATLVAELDARGALRGTRLLSPSVKLADIQSILRLPSPPGAFAAVTQDGVRAFFTGREVPALPAEGMLQLAPGGAVLVAYTYDHITAIDLASWKIRFGMTVTGATLARVTEDSLITTAGVANDLSQVIDLATGEPRIQLQGLGALSPDGHTLAALEGDVTQPGSYKLHVRGVAGSSTERTVPVPDVNAPVLAFDGDAHVLVQDYVTVGMRGCSLVTRAYVDARTGQSLPIPKNNLNGSCGEMGALPMTYEASGLTAYAYPYSESELVVSPKGAAEQHVPLSVKDGFSVSGITGTEDGHYVVACGSGAFSGAFVLDVKTGASKFTASVDDCSPGVVEGHRMLGARGVIDLDSDSESPSWPELSAAPLFPEDRVEELSKLRVPTDTPGLYCRFGELLQPYEVCGPPPPDVGAAPRRESADRGTVTK
ncbi:MAG: hypothetical protein U0414_29925 [Polyangiaceae bacterium]